MDAQSKRRAPERQAESVSDFAGKSTCPVHRDLVGGEPQHGGILARRSNHFEPGFDILITGRQVVKLNVGLTRGPAKTPFAVSFPVVEVGDETVFVAAFEVDDGMGGLPR